jgi:hypothetical protein
MPFLYLFAWLGIATLPLFAFACVSITKNTDKHTSNYSQHSVDVNLLYENIEHVRIFNYSYIYIRSEILVDNTKKTDIPPYIKIYN